MLNRVLAFILIVCCIVAVILQGQDWFANSMLCAIVAHLLMIHDRLDEIRKSQ